jgi:signal transduction histidine kinase
VRGAHEALGLELAVRFGAEQLGNECERLQCAVQELQVTQERLLHSERLKTVGRTVGALITLAQRHLVALEQFKSAQQKVPADDALAEDLQCAAESIDGFAVLLKDLLALTEKRSTDAQLQPEPLDRLVRLAVNLFRHDPIAKHREVLDKCECKAMVLADRPRLTHVLLNLLRNAAQATPKGGRIEVRTNCNANHGIIEVEDFGQGMTSEIQNRIFTPFFTTKGRAGMGLGLRLSQAAILAHNGTLECTSMPGRGTCFRIKLPIVHTPLAQ